MNKNIEQRPVSLYSKLRSLHPILITNNYDDWRSMRIDISRGKKIRRKHWPIFYNDKGFMIFHVFLYNPWAIGFGGCIGANTDPDDYLEFDDKIWYTGGGEWMPSKEDKEAMDWESFTNSDIDEWELEYGIGKYNTKKSANTGPLF